MSTIVARSAGAMVVQDGDRLLVADRRTGGLTTAIFVTGLLSFILGANAIVQLALLATGQGLIGLVIALPLAAGLVGTITWWLVKRLRARRDAPLRFDEVTCIIDTAQRRVLSPAEVPMGPIEEAKLELRIQIGSSARKLVLITPGASLTIARGHPFSGSVGPILDALAPAGLRAPERW